MTGAGNFERALRIHEAREHHAEHFQLQLKKEWHEFEAHKQHANLLDKVPDSRGEDCDASKEANESPGKRNMVEGCSRTLVGRAAVMLLIPEPAGVLANNREWSAWGMGGGLRWGGGMATAQSSTITNGMLGVD